MISRNKDRCVDFGTIRVELHIINDSKVRLIRKVFDVTDIVLYMKCHMIIENELKLDINNSRFGSFILKDRYGTLGLIMAIRSSFYCISQEPYINKILRCYFMIINRGNQYA